MLQIEQLRVLVTIAETGSLSAAAHRLYLSQPTVSHHLAALEHRIGGRLVDRSPIGSRLTELGKLVAEHAAVVLAGVERIEHDARTQSLLTLSIGSFPSAAAALLPEPLHHLREQRIGFRLEVAEPSVVARRLHELAFDVAITATEPEATPVIAGPLVSEPLLDDPLLVLIQPEHRLFSRPLLTAADLTEEAWITPTGANDPEYTLLLRTFTEAGRELQPAVRADDFYVTQALVAAGLGLALLPQIARDQVPPGLEVRRVADARFARRLHIAWRPDRTGVEHFVDDIRKTAARFVGATDGLWASVTAVSR